ncbi:MAG: hypothetical protein LBR29_00480, partial [Methylobacteriaceae bacterium]|nr:hypothetical protein [Methylobacteriaceae bacterium]
MRVIVGDGGAKALTGNKHAVIAPGCGPSAGSFRLSNRSPCRMERTVARDSGLAFGARGGGFLMDFFLYVLLPGAVFFVIVWSLIRLLPDDTFFINDFSGIPPLDKEYEKELYFQKKRREQRGDGP